MAKIKNLNDEIAEGKHSMGDSEAKMRSLERATLRAIEQMMRLRKENEKLKAENERLSEENRKLKGDLQAAGVPNWITAHLLIKPATLSQALRRQVYEYSRLMAEHKRVMDECIRLIDQENSLRSEVNESLQLLTRLSEAHIQGANENLKVMSEIMPELENVPRQALTSTLLAGKAIASIRQFDNLADLANEASEQFTIARENGNLLNAAVLQQIEAIARRTLSFAQMTFTSISHEAVKNGAVIASELLLQCQHDGKSDPDLIAMLPHYHFEEGGVFEGRTPAWLANALETVARFKKWEASIEPDAKGYAKKKTRRIFVEQTSMDPKTFYNYWNAYKRIEKIANGGKVAAESEDQSDDQQ